MGVRNGLEVPLWLWAGDGGREVLLPYVSRQQQSLSWKLEPLVLPDGAEVQRWTVRASVAPLPTPERGVLWVVDRRSVRLHPDRDDLCVPDRVVVDNFQPVRAELRLDN